MLPREPLDVERFKPAITFDGFALTEGTAVRDPLPGDPVQMGLFLNGSLNPLVVVDHTGDITQRFVSRRLSGDLFASLTLAGPVSLGAALPFFAGQGGDFAPNASGIGDVRLVPKVRVLDDRRAPLGLALLTELRLPTHSDEEFSGGARSLVFAPRLAVDHRFPFGLRVGVNGGVLLRETTTFENVQAGSELTYSAAATLHPFGYAGRLAFGVDVHGGAGLRSLNLEELPLEGQGFVAFRPRPDLEVLGGPAMGIVPGYGTPTLRGFLGIRYAPTFHDKDFDGISDHLDRCPEEAEVFNRVDDLDGCPDDLGVYAATVEVLGRDREPLVNVPITIASKTARSGSSVKLEPGRYPVTVEAPGYEAKQAVLVVTPDGRNTVQVKLKPLPDPGTVKVTILGPDGKPLRRAAARIDGVKGTASSTGVVEIEVAPGKHELWVRAKGHVPQRVQIVVASGRAVEQTVQLQPVEVEVTDQQIRLSGAVHFDTNSAKLVEESFDLLDEVVLVMQDNPSIKKLRIEGHTDSRGPEDFNQRLSEARAQSVLEYLVKQGVERERLEAEGFGESRPVSDNLDENRRVDFVIVRGKL